MLWGLPRPDEGPGGFRVDQRQDYVGKDSAAAMVVPVHAGESPLIEIVAGTRADLPLANRHKLPPTQVELLKAWIDAGARWGPRPEVDQPR